MGFFSTMNCLDTGIL